MLSKRYISDKPQIKHTTLSHIKIICGVNQTSYLSYFSVVAVMELLAKKVLKSLVVLCLLRQKSKMPLYENGILV